MVKFDIASNNFLENYFEKQMYYAKSAIETNSYGWLDFSNDFFSIEPALGTVRFFRQGSVSRENFQHGAQVSEELTHNFRKEKIIELMNSGGSMVVNRFDKSSRHVAELCRSVSDFLGFASVGNAYATKGGGGTFGMHYDAHCVFAIQLIGAKHWKVYRPTINIPISATKHVIKNISAGSEIVFDGLLEAGDVLYVPRGWWHEVNPISDTPSLHISAGVHTPKMQDYVKWILSNKMPKLEIFRQNLALSEIEDNDFSTVCALLEKECMTKESFREYMDAVQVSIGEKPFLDFTGIFKKGEIDESSVR